MANAKAANSFMKKRSTLKKRRNEMMDDETNDGRSAKFKYEVKDFSAKSIILWSKSDQQLDVVLLRVD